MSKVIKKVLLDNCVLTRMLLSHFHDYKEEDTLNQTKDLYNYLHKELKAEIYISTVVLAECLQGIDSEHHDTVINLLHKKVNIINFCSKSAKECADIFKKHKAKINIKLEKDSKNIKADFKILASAVAYNIDIIYTYDIDFSKLNYTNVDIKLVNESYPFSTQPSLI